MSSCLSVDLKPPSNQAIWPKRLNIALIGPNEKGRRTVASALKNSPNADVFEFDSYPPERGYVRAVVENPFNVLIFELDSNADLALDLIQEASECPGAAVLAYSTRGHSKLTSRALQAGALAYSILGDTSQLRQQIDRLAAAYSPDEEDLEAAGPSVWSEPRNIDGRADEFGLQLPAILPEDFDGWDDCTASDDSRKSKAEAGPILSSKPIRKAESDGAIDSSSVSTERLEDQVSSLLKDAPSKNERAFWPQTLGDEDETKSRGNPAAPSERFLKISTSKLWSGILFSGDSRKIPKFNSAQMRDADDALETMFQRGVAKSHKAAESKRRGKIAVSMSLASVLIVAIALIAWLHPKPLFTMGQTVLHNPVVTLARTGTAAKAPRPQTPPEKQMPLGGE